MGEARALEGIAVVGMACRLPGAAGVAEYWRNLRGGVESVRSFSAEELAAAGVDPALLADPRYVRAKAVLDGVELFDAGFFGMSPRVAAATDPQQRIFLECAWEALESAGYDPARYPGAIGVFAGSGLPAYLLAAYGAPELDAVGSLQAAIGNRADHLTLMVAYKLDLRGPAVTVQTTCSTSLVAAHLACQSLLDFQCDMALAGGVSIEVPQRSGYLWVEGGIASPDGHCRPFDAAAAGTTGGSGAGVVLLKRLEDAVRDGDTVHAVVAGSAVNNDGAGKIGYTAPYADRQAQVIATAQALAGVGPDEIGYVEAHGTATPMGDPIEIAALTRVFRAGTKRRGFCAVGSVKSNFGHLDTAAGAAGLIKAVLALEHREIPPSLHFERPNPALDLAASPFYVNAELRDWPSPDGGPRYAGVSAFGIGGTNAHLVLAEAPEAPPPDPSKPWQLLPLSARSGAALTAVTESLRRHLEESPGLELADVAYTLQVGRRAFSHRRFAVCRDRADAIERLASLDPARVHTSPREPGAPSLVFVFPGQGAQHAGMGREVYAAEPEFRRQLDRCAELFAPHLGLDLREALFAEPDDSPDNEAALDRTVLTQPALFAVEYALARLWTSWGVRPAAMLGHSIGEYVAACLAEVLSLADAVDLVAARGRMIQELPPGAMLAVHLPEAELAPWLGGGLDLAAVNRPALSVLSGPPEAVEDARRELEAHGVVCRPLRTSHAFHSRMMEPVLPAFSERLRGIALAPPKIPYLSNLTGTWITSEQATDPAYWALHLRRTVRFSEAAATLLAERDLGFLEVGPGTTLATLVRQHPARSPGRLVVSSLRHPQQTEPEMVALRTALGRLWLAGVEVDWQGVHAGERRRRVVLPTYPFERQRHWIDAPRRTGAGTAASSMDARRRQPDLADWFYAPGWRRLPPLPRAVPAPARWLALADPGGPADDLLDRLAAAGGDVVRVESGEGFVRHGADRFAMAPGERRDHEALLAALAAEGRLPARVLHLWTLGESGTGAPLERGFASLVALAQALGRQGIELSIDVVSSHMQEVVGGDLLAPEKAALLGPCRVIPKEYPGLRCRSLDIAFPEMDNRLPDPLIDRLLSELALAAETGEVALRGDHRWAPEFVPMPLGAPEGNRLREGGSYLVTGGLGGMGLALAEELARAAKARLTLVGRRGLPPRAAWDEHLAAHGDDDLTAHRIRQVQALESLGAEVLVVEADVADEEQMRRAVAAARERFGAIHGVIHAAGSSQGTFIQLRDANAANAANAVLAPKIRGTQILADLLAGAELDLFLLCSSRSGIFGQAGGVDYCAANAFLDAFAHHRRAQGLPALAVDWCGWREVGMLADAAAAARRAKPAKATAPNEGNEGDAGEALTHPLLERRRSEPAGRDVYLTRMSSGRHWVADEHRIAGSPVVPGTTYLEMARAAGVLRGLGDALEIHDVFFLTPIRLRDGEERPVRLVVEPAPGGCEFRVANSASGGSWEETMLGRMRPLPPEPPRRYDLAALAARCTRREIVAADVDERFEDLGPRWQNVKRVAIGDGEVFGALELPEAFAGDLHELALHPSLLDRAAGLGEQFLIDVAQGFYLPLSYASLRIRGPLPRKLYSHVRLRDADYARQETISFDVTLLDEEGYGVVEIDGYSKKRVNDGAAQLRALAANAGAAGTSAAMASPSPVAEAGAEEAAFDRALEIAITTAEGQEVFRRLLADGLPAQVVVSPNDLAAAIAEAASATPARLLAAAEALAAVSREEHERPDLTTPYAAPRDDLERRLAALWQETLGVREVGVDDNFFELGGDSVLGIQMVARARREGLEISPGQLFEYQTVAQLARAMAQIPPTGAPGAGLPSSTQPSFGAVTPASVPELGEVPLIPFQKRFLERGLANPHRFNVTQLFALPVPFDWPRLAALFARLLREHDALRLRFLPGEDGWRQALVPAEGDAPFAIFDLTALPAGRRRAAVESAAEALQGSLHLARGPLLRLAAFELAPGGESRLLFTGHHLVLDHISVYVLADELAKLYEATTAETAGREPRPAAGASGSEGSVSFQAWAERLREHAGSPEIAAESAYWLGLPWSRVAPLPRDVPDGENSGRTRRVASLALGREETRRLLEDLPQALGAAVEEILLAAVAWSLAGWTGNPVQLLQRVGHGRTSPFPELDIARTVGWFAADHPAVLDLAGAADLPQALAAVAAQARAVPREGFGYGVLRYLSPSPHLAAQFRALPDAEVSFNYLGRQSLRGPRRTSAFREAPESPGATSDPAAPRPSLLNVTTFADGDGLRLDWTYSAAIHRPATIEGLVAGCSAALARLLATP